MNLSKLANAFDNDAKSDSNYKRIQRFFRFYDLDMDAFSLLIKRWLPTNKWVLCIDRTNWKIGQVDVNILVLAVAYKKIAIPLIWVFLKKKGNSNTEERIVLMDKFIFE